jgi:hypothetical protein
MLWKAISNLYMCPLHRRSNAALLHDLCVYHTCRCLSLTVAKEAMLVQADTVSNYLYLTHTVGSSQLVNYFTVTLVLPLPYLNTTSLRHILHHNSNIKCSLRTVPAGSHLHVDALTFQQQKPLLCHAAILRECFACRKQILSV